MNIAIPLYGKMSARALHQPALQKELNTHGFTSYYFLNPLHLHELELNPAQYFGLQVAKYDEYYVNHFILQQLRMLRRFVVVTETTSMRFREMIQTKLFDATLSGMSAQMFFVNAIQRMKGLGPFLQWGEKEFFTPFVHDKQFGELGITCVLTPGIGNYGFWYEGSFAIEAQRRGIPAFAIIANYDNLVNMGYRGFTPKCLAVWSRQMADEAMHLHGFRARQIEITGPIQYDRFVQPLSMNREEFLRSIGLDPNKKTIFFAGGVNINHYFDMYQSLVERKDKIWHEAINLIVRPYPHAKLLSAPAWKVLEKLFIESGAYLSNPGSIDGSSDRGAELRMDFSFENEVDELTYLLRYSDVMVNYFSTIALEAAINDLPTIHIGYDAFAHGQNFGVTSAFLQRQTHNRRVLRLLAARVVKNEEELFSALEDYLGDRTLHKDARREYAVAECGDLDGKAGLRLVNMIRSRIGSS